MFSDLSKNSKKTSKSLKEAEMPPIPYASLSTERKMSVNDVMTDEDALKMIAEMRKTHDDIERQLDEIFQKTGWSPKYLETFLSNPNNFNSDQWEYISKEQKSLAERFQTELLHDKNSKLKSPLSVQDSKLANESRKKPFKARRNWLPMR